MNKRLLVDAMVGICVHNPDVLIEPPRNVKSTAATALSSSLHNASLSPNAKVAFMMSEGGLSIEESEKKASRALSEQMRLLLSQNGLEQNFYDIRFFTEDLPSDIKLLWAAAVLPTKKKRGKPKRISIGGIIVGAVLMIIGIMNFLAPLLISEYQVTIPEACLGWLTAGGALFIRSFHPPVGWKKGIYTFVGGLFIGAPIMLISVPLRYGREVDSSSIFVFLLLMISGILLLRSGSKKIKKE